jgi:hypothetical protein
MTAPRILGKNDVTEEAKRTEWRDGQGFFVVRKFHGPEEKIDRKAIELMNTADSFTIDTKARYSRLMAYFSDGSPIQTTFGQNDLDQYWELDSEVLEKDIRTHPFLDALGDEDAKAQKIEELDAAIEQGQGRTLLAANPASPIKEYIQLRLIGVESYTTDTYILRRVNVCANNTARKAAFTGVGKVANKAPIEGNQVSIKSRAGKPKFSLPAGEWLKRAPQVRQVGRGKWYIVEEWWYAEKWSKTLYSGGTGLP